MLRTYPFFFLGFPIGLALFSFMLAVLMLWSLFWKALGLWHSARRGQYWWFVILLIVNSVGILEIVYLFFVLKIPPSEIFSRRRD